MGHAVLELLPGKQQTFIDDQIEAMANLIENIGSWDGAVSALTKLNDSGSQVAFCQGGILNRIRDEKWYMRIGQINGLFV